MTQGWAKAAAFNITGGKYFVPAEENANHEIKGEWGLERSEIGNRWEAVRQRNMLPDLASVKPDETERVNMPDEWDSSGGAAPGNASKGEKEQTRDDDTCNRSTTAAREI